MELTLKRYQFKKSVLLWLAIALVCLIPLSVQAYAQGGFTSQFLIGSSGTSSSQLTIGSSNSPSGYVTVQLGSNSNHPVMSPTTGVGSIVNIYMPIFFLLGLVAVTWYVFYGDENWILRVVITAVIIYLLFSFMPGLQATITNLFGGISGI